MARELSRARSPRVAAAAIAFAMSLTALPAAAPAPVDAVGPLPKCRLANIMTVPRGYDDWSVTLVDWLLRVEKSYVPPDLVHVSEAGVPGGGYIREVAIDDLRAMARAAASAGAPIGIWSPYRSYEDQVEIFNGYANGYGFENAITYSHRPGHSEHQLGLGVDFMSAGGGNPLIGDWATTPAGAWMRDNSWKFGWINSYPMLGENGSLWSDRLCFTYEPWHYRYLGREIARQVHRSGLTIREYLWEHYTMVDPKTGEPIATATPTPSATPSPSPEPTPSAVPSTTPIETATPTAPAGPTGGLWFGVDPPLAAAVGLGFLGILAWIALAARRGLLRP